ncbi:zinc finger HIT domain-containing protein 2 [Cololabis saira]|uniref:zinc finger HIT domain-containing protein 2 n=1 Tax=Cololabis saira TaxID=129043 RepID=UPI002AD1FCE5|nr:zinc finger HIT domain-containing protein 2 [Cololabis saira]XP_061601120.1 zinc finger HIT domain-containing protein 2 [Cololabis saira]
MNPLIRRSLPPSVRSLLTNIGPKEEDVSPAETPSRDGILLPSRGQEEWLSPAKPAAEPASNSSGKTACVFCKCKPSCYTCPRCNLQYCGLACYQSPQHSACSEEFYKESVLQELKDMGKTESEGRKKMQEILLRLRQKAESTHGGMGSVLKEVGILTDDVEEEEEKMTEKVQVVELLSRLAELQQSGTGSTTEIEAILKRLEEIEGGAPLPGDSDEDAESAEAEPDIADRMSGLDIDELSEDELWELLNTKEKDTFMSLMKGGALGGLVPLWKPWWEEHDEGRTAVVEVLEEEVGKLETETSAVVNDQVGDNKVKTSQEVGQTLTKSTAKIKNVKRGNSKETRRSAGCSAVQNVPPLSTKIPKLTSLCANPSSLVCYGLVNALYGYAFTLTLLNGDTEALMFEFCDMVLALSEALNSSKVFSSVQEALDCGETVILNGGYFDREDPLAPTRAVEGVAHILTGRNRQDVTGYSLAALSQLRTVLSEAKKGLSKEGEEGARRQKYFLACKKCEFFQAWVLDNVHQIRILAIELWSEHSKREKVRNSMEKAKTVVEANLKKRKGNHCKLIEELSQ